MTNLSPKKFHILLENFSSPKEIWEASPKELESIPGFGQTAYTFCKNRERVNLKGELEEIERLGLRVITLEDEGYPKILRNLPTPPPLLYLKGEYLERDELAISIVGTRKCSDYGAIVAERLAKDLGKLGFSIISGMALGIDSAAHRGALSAGARTIAVLGSGFGDIYPRENKTLMERISKEGCVLSEFSINIRPDKWTFPQRNRIISGLSRGTVVVEAPEKSGALITARLALEQGREVFAVPGNVTNRFNRGAHRLIKEGAKLVEDVDDILEEFEDLKETLKGGKPKKAKTEEPEDPLQSKVLKTLEYEPIHFNDIVEHTGLSPKEVSFATLQLQMKGLIKELVGKRYVKLP